jgi:hypothetical protein
MATAWEAVEAGERDGGCVDVEVAVLTEEQGWEGGQHMRRENLALNTKKLWLALLTDGESQQIQIQTARVTQLTLRRGSEFQGLLLA